MFFCTLKIIKIPCKIQNAQNFINYFFLEIDSMFPSFHRCFSLAIFTLIKHSKNYQFGGYNKPPRNKCCCPLLSIYLHSPYLWLLHVFCSKYGFVWNNCAWDTSPFWCARAYYLISRWYEPEWEKKREKSKKAQNGRFEINLKRKKNYTNLWNFEPLSTYFILWHRCPTTTRNCDLLHCIVVHSWFLRYKLKTSFFSFVVLDEIFK